jgi:adenylate cyclase
MGDNINFTSRLVSQSKIYGAKIIVSEDVVNSVKKQFIFRFIDKVEVHGKAGVYPIYELVGKTP